VVAQKPTHLRDHRRWEQEAALREAQAGQKLDTCVMVGVPVVRRGNQRPGVEENH